MPHALRRNARAALVALLISCSAWVFARGDESAARFVTPRVPAGRSTVEQFLSQATTLERDHRWGEALRLYSDAIRQFPDDPVLRDRQLVAQLHYDLNRRYADHGFCQTVQRTEASSALAVYAEVLNKIQTYHVQEPNWSRIAQMGGQSLEVALNDATFLRNASNDVSDLQAATASQVVRQTLANYRVASSQDAYVVTSSLARQLESRIGLLPAATVYEFIFGAMIALDPYSSFMTKNQFDETMAQIEGNFVGLGVELKTQPRQLEIVNVIPDGPAGQAGLQAGDLIEGVDAQRTTQIGGDAAADLLRGPEGSDVDLEIRRGERLHRLTLVRRQVDIPSVTSARMLDQSVGYVQIASFQKTTTRDFDAAIWRLNQQGMQELIVDVRGNPGGLLTAAVEVADRFLPAGVIVSTRGRNPLEDFVHRAVANGTWSIPLVVLVDENSASASEIFAAAIADHHRGRIVGSRSYGKGSVQGIFPLTVSGGGIRLTTAKFYSPSGTAIQDHGVKPDVEVHFAAKPAGEAAEASDAALAVALNLARQSAVR